MNLTLQVIEMNRCGLPSSYIFIKAWQKSFTSYFIFNSSCTGHSDAIKPCQQCFIAWVIVTNWTNQFDWRQEYEIWLFNLFSKFRTMKVALWSDKPVGLLEKTKFVSERLKLNYPQLSDSCWLVSFFLHVLFPLFMLSVRIISFL